VHRGSPNQLEEDLVRDMTEVRTSLCARRCDRLAPALVLETISASPGHPVNQLSIWARSASRLRLPWSSCWSWDRTPAAPSA